ncbi:hypothetical protein RF11_02017 [Thelohanellus kitauei]|uniref:Uncharacterized protein n=1 Tax=Thelohanellus kitauei TaxID=669202 RepID=A0A0C2MV40_THEKT|nr:hypothetical protein RF11_02017 [Thelohanellus kitauei]
MHKTDFLNYNYVHFYVFAIKNDDTRTSVCQFILTKGSVCPSSVTWEQPLNIKKIRSFYSSTKQANLPSLAPHWLRHEMNCLAYHDKSTRSKLRMLRLIVQLEHDMRKWNIIILIPNFSDLNPSCIFT